METRGIIRFFHGAGCALLFCALAACSDGASGPAEGQGEPSAGTTRSDALSLEDREAIDAAQGAIDRKEHTLARTLLRPLAVRGIAKAQVMLGESYASDLRNPSSSEGGTYIHEAQHWFRAAAEQGDVQGQYMLGALIAMWPEKLGLRPEDGRQGLEWIEKAAHKGEESAVVLLSWLYRDNEQYRDIAKAEYWQVEADKIMARPQQPVPEAIAEAAAQAVQAEEASAGAEDAMTPAAMPTPSPATTTTATAADTSPSPPVAPSAVPQRSGPTRLDDPVRAARARDVAGAIVQQSNHHLAQANAVLTGTTPDDEGAVAYAAGVRAVTRADGTRVVYAADGRATQVHFVPQDIDVRYAASGDRQVSTAAGMVHYLANGRVCHVDTPDGLQVGYRPAGDSVVMVRAEE